MNRSRSSPSKSASFVSKTKQKKATIPRQHSSLLNLSQLSTSTLGSHPSRHATPLSTRFFSTESSEVTNHTKRARVVYEYPPSRMNRMFSLLVTSLPVLSAGSFLNTMLASPDLSLVVPSLATLLSLDLMRRHAKDQRTTVTEIVVRGDQDPVDVSVHSFFGNKSKRSISREKFIGLYPFQDSAAFSGNKVPLQMNIKDEDTVFLHRNGLFDTSGSLTPLLGYDINTFTRAPPSAPFDPNATNKGK